MTYEIIDDTDPRLVYTGEWRAEQGPLDPKNPEYNGTVHATNDPTATVSYYNYLGRVLDIFGTISPATGIPNATYSITPNGKDPMHLNQTGYVPMISEDIVSHLWLFKSGALTQRHYNMTLITDGVSQGGATFYFDFLRVQVADGSYVETAIVDDVDPKWNYKEGNWPTSNVTGDYLYGTHQAPLEGGICEFSFYGTKVAVYGALRGTYDAQIPLGYFNVDGGITQKVYASDVVSEADALAGVHNHRIYSTSGLQDLGANKHTLTISVPPSTASATVTGVPRPSPWFIDYAIYGPSPLAGAASTPVSGAVGSASQSVSNTPSSNPPNGSSQLSGGAAAGIAIGSLFLLGAIFLALLIWRRRRQHEEFADTKEFPWQADHGSSSPFAIPLHNTAGGHQKASNGDGAEPMRETSSSNAGQGGLGVGRRKMARNNTPVSRETETIHESAYSMTQTGVDDSPLEREYPRQEVYIREVDGGVRLATASSSGYEDEERVLVRMLPPSYSQYER